MQRTHTILSIATLLILLVSGCGSTREAVNTWSFRLEKGGCLDVCKSYIIDLENSGEFNYSGYQNVSTMGNHSGKLSETDLNKLRSLFLKLNWNDLEERYQYKSTDQQQNIMKYNGHTVVYYRVTPEELTNLEQFIDELIDNYEF